MPRAERRAAVAGENRKRIKRTFFGENVSPQNSLFLEGGQCRHVVLSRACLAVVSEKKERVFLRIGPVQGPSAIVGTFCPHSGIQNLKMNFRVTEPALLEVEGPSDVVVQVVGYHENIRRRRRRRLRNSQEVPDFSLEMWHMLGIDLANLDCVDLPRLYFEKSRRSYQREQYRITDGPESERTFVTTFSVDPEAYFFHHVMSEFCDQLLRDESHFLNPTSREHCDNE
mmetsp:Transcript_11447/g.34986  ORF Transcript_11447/g.34986 Transcript_11447/m.34986 type:complete len:227 (+) Transcript_11447:179-859(+)